MVSAWPVMAFIMCGRRSLPTAAGTADARIQPSRSQLPCRCLLTAVVLIAGQALGDDAGSGFEAHLQTDGAGAARAVEQLKAASPSLEALEGLNIRSGDLAAASGFEAHPQSTGQDTRHQDEVSKATVAVKPDEAAGTSQVGDPAQLSPVAFLLNCADHRPPI